LPAPLNPVSQMTQPDSILRGPFSDNFINFGFSVG
jgi:hypothetical protein